jgi:hypothetical protein
MPCFAAGVRRRRRAPTLHGIGIVFVQIGAAFENVSEAGEDRLVGAARRFADPHPIAVTRVTGKATNEPRGEDAARQVPFRCVARNASREVAADGSNRRACDVRIGAGQDDLAHDHRQPPSAGEDLRAGYDDEICSQRVIALKYSLIYML